MKKVVNPLFFLNQIGQAVQNLYAGLYFFKKPLLIVLLLSTLGIVESRLQACGGTPVPPCAGKAVFLAKFSPQVVVFPAGGGAINVPIGILPFAVWDARPQCPSPTSAALSLELNPCMPSGATIGPFFFPVAVPTTPGAQPMPVVNFVIPAGVFPPGTPPQICTVVGRYTVNFSDGAVLTGVGDTEICLVDPSPLDENEPRLDISYISESGENYKTCRRGDQATFNFLIENNDPFHAVTLSFESNGRQVARLPEGFTTANAYDNGVYSLSLPEEDTDTYAAEFTDNLAPGELLDEPNAATSGPQALFRMITLPPQAALIIGIDMRSYGMCADGSCNERLVRLFGNFDNGDPALACTSTLYVVGETAPKSVLCEFVDEIKTESDGQAIWSPAQFLVNSNPIPDATTHSAGNLHPDFGGGFLTTGAPSANEPPFSADYLRITQNPTSVQYLVDYMTQPQPPCTNQPVQGQNVVQIHGLNTLEPSLNNFPVIFHPNSPFLEVLFSVNFDQLIIMGEGGMLYNGPATPFLNNPPEPFCVFFDMCRTIRKNSDPSTDKSIHVVPFAASRLLTPDQAGECDLFEVFDNFGDEEAWTATTTGAGFSLTTDSGLAGESVEICYEDLGDLPLVPETTVSFVNVSAANGFNNEFLTRSLASTVKVPVAIRMENTALPLEWLSFDAQATKEEIVLNWTVAQHFDNKGFEIERQYYLDNRTLSGWENIGWVDAFVHLDRYTFTDTKVETGQRYYYRLKQIDNSGKYSYSKIISAEIVGKSEVLTVGEFVPNPAKDFSFINLTATKESRITMNVYNALGELIQIEKHQLGIGNHNIQLDAATWAKGVYFIVLESEGKQWTRKLVME